MHCQHTRMPLFIQSYLNSFLSVDFMLSLNHALHAIRKRNFSNSLRSLFFNKIEYCLSFFFQQKAYQNLLNKKIFIILCTNFRQIFELKLNIKSKILKRTLTRIPDCRRLRGTAASLLPERRSTNFSRGKKLSV